MKFWRELRDMREAERLARFPREMSAVDRLAEVQARWPGSARLGALLAMARSEEGAFEAAMELAERASAGLGPAAARILRAEVLLDAGRREEARALLEEARAVEPGNIAAVGLLSVEMLVPRGPKDAAIAIAALPPGAVWCPPVAARLLLFLESKLDPLARAERPPPGLHAARSTLFRPRLDADSFPIYWMDGLKDLLARLRGGRAASQEARRRSILTPLRAGDLRAAAAVLGPPSRKDNGNRAKAAWEDEVLLAQEIAFLEDRWEDVARFHREWREGGGDVKAVYPAALAAYAQTALRMPAAARQTLHPSLAEGGPCAELRHLSALAAIQESRLPRAAAELRRAAWDDDIGMERLIDEEAKLLAGLAS